MVFVAIFYVSATLCHLMSHIENNEGGMSANGTAGEVLNWHWQKALEKAAPHQQDRVRRRGVIDKAITRAIRRYRRPEKYFFEKQFVCELATELERLGLPASTICTLVTHSLADIT